MREYILEFLEKQRPSITYLKKEDHKGLFSWIWSVWLSQQEEVLSLVVVYTPISVIFTQSPAEYLLLGEADNSFYGRLSQMIRRHRSYEEAVIAQIPDLTVFSAYFQWSCDSFVENIRAKKEEKYGCKLLHFDCVEPKLGVFSLLFRIADKIEHIVLIMGRKNYISLDYINSEYLSDFFCFLFGDKFDIFIEST